MARPAVARVASIMLDCNDLDTMIEFWGSILEIKEKNRFPGYVWMTRVSRGGPALAFQQVTEKKAVKNRLHLDLSTDDPEAFIDHIEQLGGTRLHDHDIAGFHWTV
jgi:predicted enzyme related to lactoylglutathione lyase